MPIYAKIYIDNILEVSEAKQMVSKLMMKTSRKSQLVFVVMMSTIKPLKVTVEATFTLSWLDSRYTPNKDFIVDGFKLIFQQAKI